MSFYLDTMRYAKNAATMTGVIGVTASAYAVSGLPVPATTHQVEQRVESVRNSIQTVNLEVIDTQRSVLALRRNVLRSEKYTLSQSLDKSDASTRLALTRRLGEIDDELSEIDKKDSLLLDRMQSIRSAARAPV